MRILKIKGKSEDTILEQIKKEYGDKAMIISTQEERKKGFRGLFTASQWIITIAIEDEEDKFQQVLEQETEQREKKHSNAQEVNQSLIQVIKDEFTSMRKEVNEVKALAYRGEGPSSPIGNAPYKAHQSPYGHIGDSLEQEGVNKEVINEILKGTESCQNIEETARVLYNNLVKLLPMETKPNESKITFFIGSTGVGKTTTIAKLTAEYVLNQKKQLVLFTADTYRIAAIEQLKTYADILDVPIEIIYTELELSQCAEKWNRMDHIFIDTAGRSHKNTEQIKDMKKLIQTISDKQVYLVLNMNTRYKDVKKIVDTYSEFVPDFQLIITKMDETDEIGNLINIASYTKKPIAYITTGQNVPDDIEVFNQDEYVKKLLGRIKYE